MGVERSLHVLLYQLHFQWLTVLNSLLWMRMILIWITQCGSLDDDDGLLGQKLLGLNHRTLGQAALHIVFLS